MNTYWVNILNRTDDNSVVGGVTHELKLIFFPAQDAFFEENFTGGAGVNTVTCDANEIFFVISKP